MASMLVQARVYGPGASGSFGVTAACIEPVVGAGAVPIGAPEPSSRSIDDSVGSIGSS